jgi:hypothetical protein
MGNFCKRWKRRRKIGENIWFWKLSQGTDVAGNFGLEGQEITRILGARKSERLFLVGWEVNIQFGAKQGQPKKVLNLLIYRLRYILCCYYVIMLLLIIMLLLLYFLV